MTPHTYLCLDLPSRWGEGIRRKLSIEGERIELSWTPICHTLQLTPADLHRAAEAGRQMERHARESGVDTQITIPLDHYPLISPPEPSGRGEDSIRFALFLSVGEITVSIRARGGTEFATMTPAEFGGFVATFEAAERAVAPEAPLEADGRSPREHRRDRA